MGVCRSYIPGRCQQGLRQYDDLIKAIAAIQPPERVRRKVFTRWEMGIRTYRTVVFLQHLHIRVIWQTFLADGRKVGSFPSTPVQILLNLRRHIGGEWASLGAEVV
jgi:hypothetical protein